MGSMTLADIDLWNADDINQMISSASAMGTNSATAAQNLQRIMDSTHWEGTAGEAARQSHGKIMAALKTDVARFKLVHTALSNAALEITRIKTALSKCRSDAAADGLVIDETTGTVSVGPNPPKKYSDADMKRKKDALQQRVNTVLSEARSTDSALATAIDVASGVTSVEDGWKALRDDGIAEDSDPARRQNQLEAFEQFFGRPPTSPSDWRTAAALDPNSYQPNSLGHQANIVVGRIKPVPGAGVVQANAFIDTATAPALVLTNAGDNRGFDVNAMPDRSRVTFLIDYENGVVIARQNPSVKLDNGAVQTGTPDISAVQLTDGSVHIKFNAADPFTPALGEHTKAVRMSVVGDLYVQPQNGGGIRAGGMASPYPCWEVNQYAPDGTAKAVFNEKPLWDFPLALAGPSMSIGDSTLFAHFNNVFPELPGMSSPTPGDNGISPVPISPPMLSVPIGTAPLGTVSNPSTVPVVEPMLILPTFVPGG